MAYTAIDDPSAYFKCHLYTGTGSSNAQTFADTDTNMQPDMVWIKSRSDQFSHMLYDAARGVQKHLKPDSSALEATDSNSLTAFGSDGFTVGSNSDLNNSSDTYVAWSWKAGTTSGITTNGSTTITPSAYSFNQTAGISIVKYTGNGTSGAKIAHGLGVAPDIVIVKRTGAGGEWDIVSKHLGAAYYMRLSNTNAKATGVWAFNDTLPDSVNFTVGDNAETNSSDGNVAYCFANKQGYFKCGTFIGNGDNSTDFDGPFVFCGFKPAWIMVKKVTDAGGTYDSWFIHDNKRDPHNPMDKDLAADSTQVEDYQISANLGDAVSNGFKIRTGKTYANDSGETYIYMAFAEAPFVNSNGVPCTAR